MHSGVLNKFLMVINSFDSLYSEGNPSYFVTSLSFLPGC